MTAKRIKICEIVLQSFAVRYLADDGSKFHVFRIQRPCHQLTPLIHKLVPLIHKIIGR